MDGDEPAGSVGDGGASGAFYEAFETSVSGTNIW